METKEIVLETLKSAMKPMKSAEIAALAGIEKTAVDKAIQSLKKEEKIVSPKVCYYTAK